MMEGEDIYTEICNAGPGNVRVLNTVESYNQAMVPLGGTAGTTGTQSTNNSSIALSARCVECCFWLRQELKE